MSQSSQTYAALARDAYEVPQWDPAKREYKPVTLNGIPFKPLEYFDRPSGYQGTVYRRIDNGEIVVAHRGTEGAFLDIAADASMVLARGNPQAPDAIELTQNALAKARKYASDNNLASPPEVTVTGHSLGGSLAQITAHRLHLRGETFNAYGVASLGLGIQPGGQTVINHVMAADAVSSASTSARCACTPARRKCARSATPWWATATTIATSPTCAHRWARPRARSIRMASATS